MKSCLLVVLVAAASAVRASAAPPDFVRDVAPVFDKYCAGCHNPTDLEGELSLDSFASLKKGGMSGDAIVPGKAEESLLIQVLSGKAEPAMPPEDNDRPTAAEIDMLRAWIDGGAVGPTSDERRFADIEAPNIAVADGVHSYVTSLALSPNGARLAVGGYRRVELVDPASGQKLAATEPLPGKVNNVAYSADGSLFVAASGVAGVYGAATICRADDARTVAQIKGRRDALYDARLSPDGRVLATCSYDREIDLWDVKSGKALRTLTGHTGAVFAICFSGDGALLASASADATIKLWDAATGERKATLGQPEREQYAAAVSPDGQFLAAGGADKKIRLWPMAAQEKGDPYPLVRWRAAHEAAIARLAFSPDGKMLASGSEDGELTVWDTKTLTPLKQYDKQSDVVTGLAFSPRGDRLFVARLDGSWESYETPSMSTARVAETPTGEVSPGAAPTDEGPLVEVAEVEPNDAPDAANSISSHAVVSGVVNPAEGQEADVDMFRFAARQGQQLVFEVDAARQKSPLDSHVEVLDATGKPIPRVVLQAVRESYFTFRGTDSSQVNDFRLHRWEEMELNEYVYANGEVLKLWLYPRGPDSGFIVYPGAGQRYSYFGTTPITHALNEPCYVVEPHAPTEKLLANGLPQYVQYYENDDDGQRKLGADSRLAFTAPADGEYVVRVADVRGFGGEAYNYKLHVRAPRPDFAVKVTAADLTINAGSGKEIAVEVDRRDDFEGEVQLEVTGLPPGFHITSPWSIEAGQTTAVGVITADPDAVAPAAEDNKAQIVATAVVNGKRVAKEPVSVGELKLADRPTLLVKVYPPDGSRPNEAVELTVAPGETITANVVVERHGFDGDVIFGTEDAARNMPHGVIIDNIGLNGLRVLEGQTEREFFITAAKWVPETSRKFHLKAQVEGNQTSWPVILHVRRNGDGVAGESNFRNDDAGG